MAAKMCFLFMMAALCVSTSCYRVINSSKTGDMDEDYVTSVSQNLLQPKVSSEDAITQVKISPSINASRKVNMDEDYVTSIQHKDLPQAETSSEDASVEAADVIILEIRIDRNTLYILLSISSICMVALIIAIVKVCRSKRPRDDASNHYDHLIDSEANSTSNLHNPTSGEECSRFQSNLVLSGNESTLVQHNVKPQGDPGKTNI